MNYNDVDDSLKSFIHSLHRFVFNKILENKMKQILILLYILGFSFMSFAGDATRKGTSGAEQLLIPVGARSIATGGAFMPIVDGVESIYYNPAGLDRMNGSEAMFSYMNYVADINLAYVAIGAQLGDLGSLAISYKTLDFGDIPVTTFELPDGTGETYSPSFIVAGLTYSKVLTDRVSAGFTFKIIHEGIMNTSADGVALDFGVQYKFKSNFGIGATVKNIGSNMAYSGEDLKVKTEIPNTAYSSGTGVYEVDTEEFQIPSYFELSVSYKYDIDEQNNLAMASFFRNNNNLEDLMGLGLEYAFINTFYLRGGYNFLLENNSESVFDFTVGAGVDYEMASGINLTFDYAYRNVKEFPTANHIMTFKIGLQ
jgi:opacity protein-like surface antigen